MKKNYEVISAPMFARTAFRVRAYVSIKTGHVLKIRAGCRTWRNFTEAIGHYAGGRPYKVPRWQRIAYLIGENITRPTDNRDREDAMLAIARCAVAVLAYQRKLKKRKKKKS